MVHARMGTMAARDRTGWNGSRWTVALWFGALAGCVHGGAPSSPGAPPPGAEREVNSATGTFEDDVAFLAKYGDVDVLVGPSGGRVALSASYQGRVMTSAVAPG